VAVVVVLVQAEQVDDLALALMLVVLPVVVAVQIMEQVVVVATVRHYQLTLVQL
jgi:hypothetical protein